MKRNLITALIPVAAFALFYLVTSFITMNWNVSEWSEDARFILVWLSLCAGLAGATLYRIWAD